MTASQRAILEQLQQENQALRARVAELEEAVRELFDQNRQLQEKLDEQARAAARQAAPFRRRESRKVPDESQKRPGRPQGHLGAHRPVPDHIDD
jgi:chromosome segregation ATPase